MNLQYKKHKGLLYTVNDCSEAAIDAFERNPYSIEKAKYQEAEFSAIVSAASGIKIKETWLTDGVKRRDDRFTSLLPKTWLFRAASFLAFCTP